MAETIGSVILGAVGLEAAEIGLVLGITGAAVATGVGSVVLIGGSIGLQLLLAPRRPGGPQLGTPALPPPDAGHQPLRQAIPPRIVGYGRVRLAGSYMLFEASGDISYDVLALHHGKISGFVGYYLNDDVVTIDGSGVVDVMGDGRYGSSKVTIKTRNGLATETAYSEITTPLSTIWTSSHRGDGIASLALICGAVASISDFPTIFPRGLPQPSAVLDCTPIFDSRDGTQTHGTSSTYLVSSNPILQLVDFLTDSDRGMGLDYDTLIAPVLADIEAQADLCDALVSTASGGSEPRYGSNGSFPLDSDPADVINTILDTCDGWLSQNGDGSLSIRVGVYSAPTVVLESKHIVGTQIQYGLGEEDVVNELTIDYTEPSLDYKTAPGEPWRDEDDISARGKTRSQRFALPWVYSHPQARRLAKRRMAQFNALLRGTITTTLAGLRVLGERWVAVQAPDIPDLEDLVIEVRGVTIDLLSAQCQIKFVSIDPDTVDAWTPASEEGSSPTVPSKLIAPAPPVPANISATTVVFTPVLAYPNHFAVLFDNPGRSDLTFEIDWRISGGGAFTADPRANAVVDPSTGKFRVDGGVGAVGDHIYDVKIRAFAPAGAGSSFSSTTTVHVTSPI